MGIIMTFATMLLAWVIAYFLCEFKFYWCNGKCKKCNNWKCKKFDISERVRKALDKQVPREPVYYGGREYNDEILFDIWKCPDCLEYYALDCEHYEYCPRCGQHIDHKK